MKIILAKSAGFCFGVQRAVDMAFNTEINTKTYTLGHIIHNENVIEKLKKRGIESVDHLESQKMDKVIIRAHGVPKNIYEDAKEKEIEILDATCPYVTKIHKLVSEYEKKGYAILIIGDVKHPEIIGISGWTNGNCKIIKNVDDLEYTKLDKEKKYFIVSQTTYKKEVVEQVVSKLENEGFDILYKNTICNATAERQKEAKEVARQVDCMIVIGSGLSSNTQKLFEICQKDCEHTYCIQDASEIKKEWFEEKETVGVTAGASTPSDIINEVVEVLKKL